MRSNLLTACLMAMLGAGVSCSSVLGFEDLSLAGGDAGASDAAADGTDGATDAPDASNDVANDVADDSPVEVADDVFADADPDAADAAEAEAGCGDTSANPDHCGRCNHSCLEGDCVSGVCQPRRLASIPDGAWGMAVDSTSVYVAVQLNNEIVRLDKVTGAVLAQLSFTPSVSVPSWMAVDAQQFYWTNKVSNDGSIGACPLAGCVGNPPEIVDPADRPNGIATDGSKIYWAETEGGTVNRADADGSNAEVLAGASEALRPFLLTLYGGFVFFSDLEGGRIVRVPLGGGTLETMGLSSAPAEVAVTSEWVYWTNGVSGSGGVFRVPNTDPPAGGHPAQVVAGNQDYPLGIAADESNVYWISSAHWIDPEGTLSYCPKSGCPSGQPIHLEESVPYPIDVVADEEALYYSVYGIDGALDGEIRKVAKP